jgi:glucose-6-phosphate-specific signal transduction histidine kinase
MVVLLAFFVFYISRSGNSGSLLPFEAQIRNWLEDTLNVRPRTKEIFFAFPIMTIMIIMWKQNKWVRLMLPITTLGLASICNTFTHFHTPIYISLTRTIISIGVGSVIGMLICMIVMSFLEFKKTTPKN